MQGSFISELFPKHTPMELLIEHAKILSEVTKDVKPLVEKYFNHEDIGELVDRISDKESKADKIKFKLRKMFHKRIKTPYTAKDLLEYLHKQDFLIDSIEDISKKLSLNRIDGLDEEVQTLFLELVDVIIKAMGYLEEMTENAKKAINTSFAKKVLDAEESDSVRIEDLEGEVDKLSLKIGKWIYSHKNKLNPIDLIFFRELVLLFVEIADEAENTAELLNALIK
ncbi:MAG: DUF47 family protein [Candidatus Mcinerneyibacterium aminivorans]|uniref:DUF47 family protein n=1 Tax=Candidatus Mcinerneyibacterium aminivorans TaxID=2703815 RepID=A0A5D0MAW6_9BACT|nr:MAG: DUF47 family protein [Candidatus Mcinerneyibacterium aminivorans]